MKSVLLHILRALVEFPEALEVSEIHGQGTIFIELRCHPDDVGILIGRNGKTISAIRTLLNALAHRENRAVVVEVIEP